MKARVNSFQSLGTVDGPGVRTVVFMQGCPLRCPYCHNPETWDKNGGTETTDDEIVEKVLRYKPYFGQQGGITVSGGEPLLQAEFVTEVFRKLKAQGVSTALDTSGCIIDDKTDALLKQTDIVLLDIKFSTDEKYKKYIGISIDRITDFLKICDKSKKRVIIRQVVTPQVNDMAEDMKRLKGIADGFGCIEKVELLPFRKFCTEKYNSLGIEFPFGKYEEMPQKKIEDLQNIFK